VSPKEYKDTVAELNRSHTNRVFEFFKVTAPERVGFAKHREAVERKAAALAAADVEAGETATSPRGAPTKKTSRKVAPAAASTATAEGKAQKKRGARPTDSPPTAKRTRVVDVETGVVETVIAVVPLHSAAPSGGAGEEVGGTLLVPLSPKEKDNDEDSDVRIVSSVGELPAGAAPRPSVTKTLMTKANPAPPPPARRVLRLRTLVNPPHCRQRAPKKTILSLRQKKRKRRRSPKAATTA
jgi:hypothetical protein